MICRIDKKERNFCMDGCRIIWNPSETLGNGKEMDHAFSEPNIEKF